MSAFPSIQIPEYPLEETTYLRQVKTSFESGHVLSRKTATVAKRKWKLEWPAMTTADYDSLYDHFIANIGSTFSWTFPTLSDHILSAQAVTVRYAEDSLIGKNVSYGRWQVSVTLEEA